MSRYQVLREYQESVMNVIQRYGDHRAATAIPKDMALISNDLLLKLITPQSKE